MQYERVGHAPRFGRASVAASLIVFGGSFVLAACGGAVADQPGSRAIDRITNGVAGRMELQNRYLDEKFRIDTTATGLARIAAGSGDVLRKHGDVSDTSGAVIVARFSATYDESGFGGGQRTIVRCRKFTVSHSWFHVDVEGTDCPKGPPLLILRDNRGWRKCPKVAVWRPVDAPEPCNPGG